MFAVSIVAAVVIPFFFFFSFWSDAKKSGWIWLNHENVKLYVDAIKTFLTASGIAGAAAVASLGGKISPQPPAWIVQRAVLGLVVCVVGSPITILMLYRFYERAASRYHDAHPDDKFLQGNLKLSELAWLLLAAYITVEGFVIGFLYLARIPFHM